MHRLSANRKFFRENNLPVYFSTALYQGHPYLKVYWIYLKNNATNASNNFTSNFDPPVVVGFKSFITLPF